MRLEMGAKNSHIIIGDASNRRTEEDLMHDKRCWTDRRLFPKKVMRLLRLMGGQEGRHFFCLASSGLK